MKFIHDKIFLTCEDNMDLMARTDDEFFDVAIVDPEYGIGESSKNHKSRNTPIKQKNGTTLKSPQTEYQKKDWDNKPPEDVFFSELRRVSRNQVIFGANYFKSVVNETFKPPRRNQYQDFIEANPFGWIIWDKVNGSNDFNDCELIYTTYKFKSFVVYYMWNGMMQGQEVSTDLQKALIQIGNKKLNEKRIHPTQKPIKIYKWLINFLNLFGLKLLDTNIGLMSIVIACYDAECEITGCDKEIDYFEKGTARVLNHINQFQIFK